MIAKSIGSSLSGLSGIITPTHDIHPITGDDPGNTIYIDTINVPSPNFAGSIILTNIDSTTGIGFNTGSNIAKAIAASNFQVNTSYEFYYNPNTLLWYPVGI